MKKSIFTLALGLMVGIGTMAQSLKIISEKAQAEFKVVSEDVTGTFTGMEATIEFNEGDLSDASIKGSIPVNTVSTGNKTRDEHLQAEEYFHAAKFPKMEFESSKIEKTDKGFLMTGKMTIRGVTKDVRINFVFKNNVFEGKTVVYTNDFDFAVAKKRDDSKILVKFTVPVE